MAAKSSVFDNDFLRLTFTGQGISGLADNAATSPLVSLFVSLHTAVLTPSSTQSSTECTYTGYARVPVARSASGFTVTGNSVSPAATISFGPCTAGSETATYFAIGTNLTGSGKILYFGAIAPTIAIANGVTPQLAQASAITEV